MPSFRIACYNYIKDYEKANMTEKGIAIIREYKFHPPVFNMVINSLVLDKVRKNEATFVRYIIF